jgi:hypothetical protein
VNGTGSGTNPVAGFRIRGIEPSDSTIKVLVITYMQSKKVVFFERLEAIQPISNLT